MSNRKAARGGGKVAVSSNVATGGAVENNDTKEANDDVIMINNNKRELTLDSNKGEVQTAVIKEDFGKEEPEEDEMAKTNSTLMNRPLLICAILVPVVALCFSFI